jgi:hypothetical protein
MDLFNRPRLPQRRYPSSFSPVPSNCAAYPRRRQIADAHGLRAAVPTAAARSDPRQASCGSGWIRSSSHFLRPRRPGVDVHRAAGVCDPSPTRDRARATLGLGSLAHRRFEPRQAKRCGRSRQVARRNSMASAREGYRRAQHLGGASHCYDV